MRAFADIVIKVQLIKFTTKKGTRACTRPSHELSIDARAAAQRTHWCIRTTEASARARWGALGTMGTIRLSAA